jgi:hypothetical protein
MDCCTILLEERAVRLVVTQMKENCAGIWTLLLNEFVPKRAMGTAILVALMLHHTASCTARKNTYIN